MPRASAVVHAEIDKEQLALAIARNQVGEKLPVQEILQQQGVTEAVADKYLSDPTFVAYVKRMAKELTEAGFGFEMKSRILAEEALKTVYKIVNDPDAPDAVRMKGIENLVEWGGLKPKNTAATGANAGPGFTIQIVVPQAVREAAIAEGVQDAIKISTQQRPDVQDAELVDEDTEESADE